MNGQKKTREQLARDAVSRSNHYRNVFMVDGGKTDSQREVLEDLKNFCRGGYQSTFVKNDPHGRQSALLEGRREVLNRILSHINVSNEELEQLRALAAPTTLTNES